MKFYFCETCGKRLTEKDLNAGAAKDKRLKGVFCTDCAVGVMTMESMPLDEDQAEAVLREAERPASGQRPTARRAPTAPRRHSTAHLMAGTPRREREAPAPARHSTLLMALGGGGALLLIVGLAVVLSSSGPPARTTSSKKPAVLKSEASAASMTPVPAPSAAERPIKEAVILVVPSATDAEAPAVPEATPKSDADLSPKERFEKMVREGKIKPKVAEPEPAPLPAPPAADLSSTDWTDLLADGMAGWKQNKGKVRVTDGVLVADSSKSNNGVHLETKQSFGNFECRFQVKLSGWHFWECWIRGSAFVTGHSLRDGQWHAAVVRVEGGTCKAWVDDKPLEITAGKPRATGSVGFYTGHGGVLSIKDLKIRALGAATE